MRADRAGHYNVRVTWTNDLSVEQFRANAAAVLPAPPAAVSASATEEVRFAHDERVERQFWKQLAQGHGAFYGADMLGSLFDADAAWNMARLDNLLQALPRVVGINEPYLYWGSWRAMFAWHVEDKDLFSINYLHFGEPKSWYGINPELADFFEGYCQSFFDVESRVCGEFLRHKFCMVDPAELSKHQIVVQRTTQRVGEFVVTFPRAYHAGFNHGFNCAEAVNFAFESWLDTGDAARVCTCNRDAVKVDVAFLRKVAGELPPRLPYATPARRYPMAEEPLSAEATAAIALKLAPASRSKMTPVPRGGGGAAGAAGAAAAAASAAIEQDVEVVDLSDVGADEARHDTIILESEDDGAAVVRAPASPKRAVARPRKPAVRAKRRIMSDSPPAKSKPSDADVVPPLDEQGEKNAALLRALALPLTFDCDEFVVTVVCLGQLTTLTSFQRATVIVPVGYVATCTFQCARAARKKCAYVCEVLIENNKPRFRVMPPCAPGRATTASTADGAWSKMHETIKHCAKRLDGDLRFGLALPAVRRMLQLLPGADALPLYEPIGAVDDEEVVRETETASTTSTATTATAQTPIVIS